MLNFLMMLHASLLISLIITIGTLEGFRAGVVCENVHFKMRLLLAAVWAVWTSIGLVIRMSKHVAPETPVIVTLVRTEPTLPCSRR